MLVVVLIAVTSGLTVPTVVVLVLTPGVLIGVTSGLVVTLIVGAVAGVVLTMVALSIVGNAESVLSPCINEHCRSLTPKFRFYDILLFRGMCR